LSSKKNSVAERIRACRERLGLSQRDLALAVGTSQTSVSAWETGVVPRGASLKALAEAFKVSIDWLRSGEGTEINESLNEDGSYRTVFIMLDSIEKELGLSIDSAKKLEIMSILYRDALQIGIQFITRERIESLLKIAPKSSSTLKGNES
jgi:transcriptional regulator with XRE-family HTH domain